MAQQTDSLRNIGLADLIEPNRSIPNASLIELLSDDVSSASLSDLTQEDSPDATLADLIEENGNIPNASLKDLLADNDSASTLSNATLADLIEEDKIPNASLRDLLVDETTSREIPSPEAAGAPLLPEETPTFEDLAATFEAKKQTFVEAVVGFAEKNQINKPRSEIASVFNRFAEAIKERTEQGGKINLYDEAQVVLLFDELKGKNGYETLMDAFLKEGLSEQMIDTFRGDTMITSEHEKNVQAYLRSTKKGDVLKMYNDFLIDLEQTRTRDGKYDLKQLSPLKLYLLSLASTRMADTTDGKTDPVKLAEYEKTIVSEPTLADKMILAQEKLKGLPVEEREKIFALEEKIKRGDALSPEDEELRKKHADILEVKEEEAKPETPPAETADFEKMSGEELIQEAKATIDAIKKGEGNSDDLIKRLAGIYARGRDVFGPEAEGLLLSGFDSSIDGDIRQKFGKALQEAEETKKKKSEIAPPQGPTTETPENKGLLAKVREIIRGARHDSHEVVHGGILNKRAWLTLAGIGVAIATVLGTFSRDQIEAGVQNAPPAPVMPSAAAELQRQEPASLSEQSNPAWWSAERSSAVSPAATQPAPEVTNAVDNIRKQINDANDKHETIKGETIQVPDGEGIGRVLRMFFDKYGIKVPANAMWWQNEKIKPVVDLILLANNLPTSDKGELWWGNITSLPKGTQIIFPEGVQGAFQALYP